MFGRRSRVETLEETPDLQPIENPTSLDDLVEAIEEIAIDGIMSPHTKSIETLERVYNKFNSKEVKQEYVTDQTLLRRINAARRHFNKWKDRKLRSSRIPSAYEAGPSKYDFDKAQKKSRLTREAKEELDERLDGVRAAARGGRQRALESVGSSVAEANNEEAASKREETREKLEEEMIVEFRNPQITIGRVVRINKKTVTVEYDRGFTEDPLTGEDIDPMATTRVDLDSEWLTLLTDADTIEKAEQQQEKESESAGV